MMKMDSPSKTPKTPQILKLNLTAAKKKLPLFLKYIKIPIIFKKNVTYLNQVHIH